MTKVKSVPFSQVKQKLLNTPEAVKGYEDADKELEMVEMLYEMREKAGLTKSALAERMGLRPSAISRLESNPYQTDIPRVSSARPHSAPLWHAGIPSGRHTARIRAGHDSGTVSPFVHSTHSPPVLAYFMCRHNGALPEFVKESVVHITLCLSPFSGDSSG